MLVPQPISVTYGADSYHLDISSTVRAPEPIAALLRELLTTATGLPLLPADGEAALTFGLDPTIGSEEEFRLRVSADGVRVSAGGLAGLRWAVHTIRQLLPAAAFGAAFAARESWSLPFVDIVDRPRYAWRGAMLDVGRWYKPLPWLHTLVDLIAMHRMNVLHLHLTEDQGWRFEVKRYPRLTSVGAYRRSSPAGHEVERRDDGQVHGGYYTQDELRALVAYADRRGVTIVPEIDLPGHAQAAIAAYPELGNDPAARHEVWTRFGISPHVLNTDDTTVDFMRGVLDELMDVFPARFIHLGGDEVPTTEWAANPAARARMATLGLADPGQLLPWWISQLSSHVRARGRTPVVWDELVGACDAIIMAWRGQDRVGEALAAGHRVVAAPHTHLYLNYPASADPGEPLSIAAGDSAHVEASPLSKMYGYRPEPPGYTPSGGVEDPAVIGLQANLWTEYAATPARAEYDLMPRLAAVAEVAWGTAGDEADLRERLKHHLRRLDHAGITYRPLD